jgi:hypothetical protein
MYFVWFLDEIDSGLDIDALKVVSKGINEMRGEEFGALMITLGWQILVLTSLIVRFRYVFSHRQRNLHLSNVVPYLYHQRNAWRRIWCFNDYTLSTFIKLHHTRQSTCYVLV